MQADAGPVKPEHRWPPIVAVTAAILLYAFLPNEYEIIPRWILPTIGVLILIPQLILNPHHLTRETRWSRVVSIVLAFSLFAANQVAIVVTVRILVMGGHIEAPVILLSTFQVWVTDVVAFGLIFWELDRGGPVARRMRHDPDAVMDFRFPQEDNGLPTAWRPAFVDYLYFALSNMMAFSPTDVMPLTARAKGLMALQSLTGFVLLALVISRAVNILA
ncbi:hypothetical protein GCM10009840_24420 [Pseudolysinimonas kribbensis]|uniref:DUF1345 domain-containing protein n=1 Tax=Pseudolysinimonas kribbensis TaxID=433641 RepID=A0ABQ6KEV4_9MICO|nr:DUF1345 domain-containing protein [Pseudolysinimonas kribbensis]GMA96786.1 hypothetical protein GCM10025881_36100 [Pseudolysinimonas kribbensis]